MTIPHKLHLDMSFPRHYECEQVDDLPPGQRFYFPGATTEGGSDGPIVRITPYAGDQWLGVFAFGQLAPKDGATGLFTFPNPDTLCVVSKGDGYLVEASDPTIWKPIEVHPICEVVPVPNRNLIVFGNYTEMTALGETGLVWKTNRLAWSEMKITQVTDNYIEGETWDIRSQETVAFRVDLQTGETAGGIVEV